MSPPDAPSIYQFANCFITYGSMGYVDPNQVPRKNKPWSRIEAQRVLHTVDLIFPSKVYEIIKQHLNHVHASPTYSRVTMRLEDILAKDFFLEHIKQGDLIMISDGKDDVDNLITLKNGILDIYLDKEMYERAGLVGKPHGPKGCRGSKPRWIVSYDLNSSFMRHGKNSFDRLVYASKVAFPQQLSWLVCNLHPSTLKAESWLRHSPTPILCNPEILEHSHTAQAPTKIAQGDRAALEISATETYEWLSLVRLGSPRVGAEDHIDPYLARYHAPEGTSEEEYISRCRWRGFISPEWLRETLTRLLNSCPKEIWFALTATEFSTSAYGGSTELSILRPGKGINEYLMWEIRRG